MAEYKVGDKVRIVTEKTGGNWNSEGKMDKWLGKVMTVKEIYSRGTVKMVEDNQDAEWPGGWSWKPHMIAGLAELTFIQLIEKLPELAVGTEFKGSNGDVYVEYQKDPHSSTNKFFYWKSSGKPVSVSEVVLKYKFIECIPEPPKPEYTEIKWQEALQIVADGGTVYADGGKVEVNKITDLEDEINCYDFDDLLDGTKWFKKTE